MRTEDGYIVNKCLEGDSASFGLLVDKYKGGVYALAYSKLGNFHDAEDVTQEVFIKAYQKLRSLRRWDNFLAWLHAITLNLCKDWIRARSRRPDREFIADQDPRTLRGFPTDPYRENPLSEVLHEALDSLSESYRQVLTLYYLGGMNSREIAEFLGMSPAAVRQRLSRARSRLKEGIGSMMNQAFEGQRLQAGFTFGIVEAVKRIKIHPMPRMTGLPWGISLAAGIMLTIISLNPHLSLFNSMGVPTGSPLPSETKVLKVGEIPVEVLKVARIPFIACKQGNGNSGGHNLPDLQEALFLAPQRQGDTWTKKADMPTARAGLSTSVVSGKIYAIGGSIDGNSAIAAVEEYDPAADKWTKKADMPTARAALCTSAVNGKIYAFGGGRFWGDSLSTVEEYDPATNKWTRKADMPTARAWFSASTVNGKIYAIGGGWGGGGGLSAAEEYDPANDRWTKKADMPTARGWHSASALNGKIYVIGGSCCGWAKLSTVEEYDPADDRWTKKADMPTARNALSASAVGGKTYAIGGEDSGRNHVSIMEEYDPVTDIWTRKADMLTTREALATSVVSEKIYAIGGAIDFAVIFSTVEEYDTGFTDEGKSIETTGKLPTTWGEVKRREDRATR
jgi:RNA polymerase sigma factor (sigma-70 family)